MPSDELKKLSVDLAAPTKNARGGINRVSAREASGQVAGGTTGYNTLTAPPIDTTITAEKLAAPVTKVTVPEPVANTSTSPDATINAVANETNNIITAQTEEAKKLKELRDEQNLLGDQPTLSSVYNDTLDQYQVPDNIKKLKDIQLRLAEMDTGSELTKARIAGAGGQTYNQGQRELTQQDKENAIRRTGLAATAAVLQGNIETAQSLAAQTADLAFKDRNLENTNLINQINSLQGVVDDQTSQLLEQEKRTYEEDQAKVEELRSAVEGAVLAGATESEVRQLTGTTTTDEQKLTLAQSIRARQARIDNAPDSPSPSVDTSNVPTLADGSVDTTSQQYIENLLASTAQYKENPTQSERASLAKFQTVIAQTGNLIQTLDKVQTDPIVGFFRNLNPYDFDARAVNAQLSALVPNVARGVYGEVGVLTDADIRNYMKTLPNITSTEDQNKFVGLLTLKNAQRSLETTLKSLANSQVDVSGWVNDYKAISNSVASIEQQLGVDQNTDQQLEGEFNSLDKPESSDNTDSSPGFWQSIGNFFFGS